MKKVLKIKRKLLAVILGLVIIAVIGGIIYFLVSKKDNEEIEMQPGKNTMDENVIMTSGITAAGMTEEKYELDFLDTALYIEESYLSVGDRVEKGTKAFKVSGETLKKAAKELERAATEAELAYRQGVIDYETEKSNAESTYKQKSVNKEYAQAEYDNFLLQEKQEINDLEKKVEEAQELFDEYTAVVENNYYYTYYNVDQLKETYYDNFSYLMELYEKWNIEGLYDRNPSGGSSGMKSGGTESGNMGASDDAGKLTVYEMMEELVEKNGKEYETALENYETGTKLATASLDQAKSNLATLQAELEEARLEYEKQMITAQTTYDTTIAQSENAEKVYDTDIQKLDEKLATLLEEKEDTAENLELFKSILEDGYFHTNNAGTIVRNRVRAGSYLSKEDILMAYSNPETVTIAAAVDQSVIAKIEVGDSAYAVISEYGNYDGKVISVNPISTSDSKSSVTYTVTVELQGDIANLESNLTAYVYFGMSAKQMEQMRQVQQRESDESSRR